MGRNPNVLTRADLWRDAERRRLVRLCAAITRDRDAAEDLAQETLLEAWRHRYKLHDPAGADRWLAAIARNVCLRWARTRGRDVAAATRFERDIALVDDFDVEVELERAELVELLDRALSLLPPQVRDVLIHRYVNDSPRAEIAARLGVSEDAVSMRLSRGKLMLRKLLAPELGDEAEDAWRETRVWCTDCGNRKLLVRREPGLVAFRCLDCNSDVSAEFRLDNPTLAGLVGDLVRPAAIITRVAQWSRRYYGGGLTEGHVECSRCGRSVRLRPYNRGPGFGTHTRGLYAECAHCGEVVSTSVAGLALAQPQVREFRRSHPRVKAVPYRDVERDGVAAIVVRYEDLLGNAGVDAVFARDTLRVLEVGA